MTAVIDLAEARLAASIMMSCSITASFTGDEGVWMMKTWAPRIDSSNRQWISPSANSRTLASVRLTPSWLAMSLASSGWQRPSTMLIRRLARELAGVGLGQAHAELVGDVFGQLGVPAPGHDDHPALGQRLHGLSVHRPRDGLGGDE